MSVITQQQFLMHASFARCRMQMERLEKQAQVRAQLWTSAMNNRSPGLALASMVLRVSHALGNHTKTAIMTSLLLFKVCSRISYLAQPYDMLYLRHVRVE